MKTGSQAITSFHLALAALAVIVALMAARSYQVAGVVLEAPGSVTAAARQTESQEAAVATLEAMDRRIASSAPCDRDPFSNPQVLVATRPGGSAVEPAGSPLLRMLLYDNVSPTVQLSVGEALSGPLHVGDTFRGWTVDAIRTTSVLVSRGGETLVLSSS